MEVEDITPAPPPPPLIVRLGDIPIRVEREGEEDASLMEVIFIIEESPRLLLVLLLLLLAAWIPRRRFAA